MPAVSKFVESLPEGYGYVILAGVGNVFLNAGMAGKVGAARKKYEVEYPKMYHEDPNHVFNCIQRVHQNTCEGNANFLFLLLVGGLQYPKVSAACGGLFILARMAFAMGYYTGACAGVLYLAARVAFAQGYYTGDPKKRVWGAFGHIADLILIGNVVSFALHEIKCWPCNK